LKNCAPKVKSSEIKQGKVMKIFQHPCQNEMNHLEPNVKESTLAAERSRTENAERGRS
jgi:hypothetical protein